MAQPLALGDTSVRVQTTVQINDIETNIDLIWANFQSIQAQFNTLNSEVAAIELPSAVASHFGSTDERDRFFGVAANRLQLMNDDVVLVYEGNNNVSWYVWTGGDTPSTYNAAGWVRTSGLFPTGSTLFGGREILGAAGIGFLGVEDQPTGTFYHTLSVEWDSTGSRAPAAPILQAETTITLGTDAETGPSQSTYSFELDTSSVAGITDLYVIRVGTLNFATAPTKFRSRIWEGTDTSVEPISDIVFDVAGAGVQEFGPPGADRQFFKDDTTYTTQYDGLDANNAPMAFQLRGATVNGTFVPWNRIKGNPASKVNLATETFVTSQISTMTVDAADVTLINATFTGIFLGSANVETALERLDATGIGTEIFRFTGNYSASAANIAEWFNNRAQARMRGLGSGVGSGAGTFTFDLPNSTDLGTVFDTLVSAGLPEVFRMTVEYTGGEPFTSVLNNRLSIRPRVSPSPQIQGRTNINLANGQTVTLEITRTGGVISNYQVVAGPTTLEAATGTSLDDIELQSPINVTWDAAANAALPTNVLKGYAFLVVNAPANGSGRFGEAMQNGDWVVWFGDTFTSWDATPHQWFVLAGHDVRRITQLEADFLRHVSITPTSDRNAVTRGAAYDTIAPEIRLKIYATAGDYTPADLNTTGDIDAYTDPSSQTGRLGIRLFGRQATLEAILPTLYVYAEDASGNFTRLLNLATDFTHQGDFGAESDYLSDANIDYLANETLRIFTGTSVPRYSHDALDVDEANLTAPVQAKLNRTDGGGTTDEERLRALESKMDALFPLTPDVVDLTDWASIYNPAQTTQTVTITDGYSLIADYRGDATRFENAGVTYSDAGTNVVTYTGLGDNLFRTFGFKVNGPADQVLMWIVDGAERIPFVDMTAAGNFRINHYTPATVENHEVTGQNHFLTRSAGTEQVGTATGSVSTFTITKFPANATNVSRLLQVDVDIFQDGVDTLAGEFVNPPIVIPATNVAQARQTRQLSVYLGPSQGNRTVIVTIGYEFRVSGSDLLVDLTLVEAPEGVTVVFRDVAASLSYTAPATTPRVDNFQTFRSLGSDYVFTGENELMVTFQPHPFDNAMNAVAGAITASTGAIALFADVAVPQPAHSFESVEIPDQTALSGFEFRAHSARSTSCATWTSATCYPAVPPNGAMRWRCCGRSPNAWWTSRWTSHKALS